jgi:hypothetical protein
MTRAHRRFLSGSMKLTRSIAAAGLLILSVSVPAYAEEAPAPPPSAAKIKECVKQMDIANQWRFDWKVLEIGSPRHPQNNYEALSPFGGNGRRDDYGYPVHVAYDLGGFAKIDTIYWLIRDANGHWQIPAICVLP